MRTCNAQADIHAHTHVHTHWYICKAPGSTYLCMNTHQQTCTQRHMHAYADSPANLCAHTSSHRNMHAQDPSTVKHVHPHQHMYTGRFAQMYSNTHKLMGMHAHLPTSAALGGKKNPQILTQTPDTVRCTFSVLHLPTYSPKSYFDLSPGIPGFRQTLPSAPDCLPGPHLIPGMRVGCWCNLFGVHVTTTPACG